jgi:two-component system phosphate regulon sensor histidine kinase PhoR
MAASRTRHISAQLKRVLVLIFTFVVTPSAGLLAVGIVLLAIGRASKDIVLGVLIVSLAATMAIGTVAALVYVFRSASLARLQTDFVSRVSHDLKTPLTSIRMFLETLQLGRASDPETQRQCLELMATETTRLANMIDRLLHWGRREAGRRPYALAPAPPLLVIERALEAFAPTLATAPAVITTDIEPDLPLVAVDLDAMVEALLNLLQNAHRYSGEDKRIHVTARRAGKLVALAVADNGVGIAKTELRRVFEKFYRGSHAVEMAVPGSGLGLAIVDHVVRAHRGRVMVDSEPGRGSTFTVLLQPARGEPRA